MTNNREFTDQDMAKYLTLPRRIFAGMFDVAIVNLVLLVLQVIMLPLDRGLQWFGKETNAVIVGILYPIIMIHRFGGTFGKLFFGLTVSRIHTGTRLSWTRSTLRESFNIVIIAANYSPIFLLVILQVNLKNGMSTSLEQIAGILGMLLISIEIFTAMLSSKRRSILDVLGGSVVTIVKPYRKWSRISTLVFWMSVVVLGTYLQVFVFRIY